MPFGPHMLISTEEKGWIINRVYYEPQQDDGETFVKALDDVIEDAQRYAVTEDLPYDAGLPRGILLRICCQREEVLPSPHQEALQERGFVPDPLGWALAFPLSWELDQGYRSLQEELNRRVEQGDPRAPHGKETTIAAYNMRVLSEVARTTLGLELDGSFESIQKLDELLLMERVEPEWRFRVFSPATLVACGDYTSEVAIRSFPELHWGSDEKYPLEFEGHLRPGGAGGGKLNPRGKAVKRCLYGASDSLYSLISVIISLVRQNRS
ncbi:hypothetical protein [Thermogemmatispora sp.]|uniref:hypothetical protein n=1 Tax=Thermogemmatispora sp. TaxID=1968838 RepID=UPI0035E41974